MSPSSAQRKGDKYEREAVARLRDLTGWPIERARHAGRTDDIGDLYGLPNCTVQVKAYPSDLLRSISDALREYPKQQANRGTTFGFGLVRRPGGLWAAVMHDEMAVTLLREATG